jgi:hypothetical protein
MMQRLLLVPVALLALAAPCAAQNRFTGSWIAQVSFMVGRDSTGAPRTQMAQGRMTLTQTGDSVRGTWQTLPPAELPIPPMTTNVAGVVIGGRAQLTSEPATAVMRGSAGETRVSMKNSWNLEMRGDTIAGTQQASSVDGNVQSNPRPFTAVRETP